MTTVGSQLRACLTWSALASLPLGLLGPSTRATAQIAKQQVRHNEWQWTHFTTADGLPHNSITSLVQTRDGYIWAGTHAGLARFDGLHFRVFDVANTSTLGGNRILSLLESKSGDLWIGTRYGGVTRLQNGVFTSFKDQQGAPFGAIRSIVEDRTGAIWFGAGNLVRYADGEFHAIGPDEGMVDPGQIWSLHVDRDNKLWVATDDALVTLPGGLRQRLPVTNVSINGDGRWSINEDPHGRIWVDGADWSAVLEDGRLVPATVQANSPGQILAAATDDRGNCWIGGRKGVFTCCSGKGREDGSAVRMEYKGLAPSLRQKLGTVQSLLPDRDGNMWVGTKGHGLFRVREAPFTLIPLPFDGALRWASAPLLSGLEGIWLAQQRTLAHFDGDSWKKLPLPATIDRIDKMASTASGALWIAHDGNQLSKIENDGAKQIDHDLGTITGILESRRGITWLCTEKGLATLIDGRIETLPAPDDLPPLRHPVVMHESADGTLWIGANGAAIAYRDGEFIQHRLSDDLPGCEIRSIVETHDGVVWVATYGNGLIRLQNGKIIQYTKADGLPDNALGKIIEDDDGNLWINSNRGVFQVRLNDLYAFTDARRSLIYPRLARTGEGNGWGGGRTRDGTLWFPTVSNLVLINPREFDTKHTPPSAITDGITVDGRHRATDLYRDEWRWVRFGEESGLPSTDVLDLVESSDGTLWAVTGKGLAWFDGFRWRPVEIEGTPALDHVTAVAADAKDRIVIVTGGWLYRGDRSGFRRIRLAEKEQEEPLIRNAVSVNEDQLMMVADTGALLLWDGHATRDVAPPGGLTVSSLNGSRDGSAWLGNASGTYRWIDDQWVHHVDIQVDYLQTDDRGSALATTNSPPTNWVWTWEPEGSPRRLDAARDWVLSSVDLAPSGDAILIRSTGDVLIREGDDWWPVTSPPRELQKTHMVRFQRNGDLWTVTSHGVYLCRRSLSRWSHWSLGHPHVHVLLRTTRGELWAGHADGIAIVHPDGKYEPVVNPSGISFGVVTGLAEDADGGVWVSSGASFSGAYRWHNGSWRHYGTEDGLPDARIHRIVKDRRGRLWFLGISADYPSVPGHPEPGAYVLDGGRFTPWGRAEGLQHGRVYAFTEGSDGSYWFGTLGGLSRWHQGEWTHWTQHDGLRTNMVFALAAGDDGRVWFGHQYRGLGYIDEDDAPVFVEIPQELNNSGVWDLQFDAAGALWIATTRGLGKYSNGVFSVFGTFSGLGNARLWPVLPEHDKVYVGTRGGGLWALNLAEAENPVPQVTIRPPLTSDDQILIGWDVHPFQTEQAPDNVQTRFRLDDGAWSPWTTTHEAVFSKLAYGDHVIAVQAMSLFGNVGPEPTTLTFHNPQPVLRSAPFTEPWRWSHFTAQDGLPSNRISDVCESHDGTIWAATAAGLAWYDGFVWHAMGSADGVPGKMCHRIMPDQESGILATIDGNLYRGDRHGFRQVPIPPESNAQHILVAAPAHGAGLLLLGHDVQNRKPVYSTLIDGALTEIRDARGVEPAALEAQWGTSESEIWGRIAGTLDAWGNSAWRTVPLAQERAGQADPAPRIDAEGFFWIERPAPLRGLWEWRSGHQPRKALPVRPGRIDALAVDADGRAIAVTDSGVVHVRQKDSWYELSPTPPQFSGVRSLQFGSNGDLWIASHSGVSLYRTTDRFWQYWRNHAEGSTDSVHEIIEASDGRVWIATNDGVEIHSPSAPVERFSRINDIDVRISTGLAEDRDGNIWLSSGWAYEGAFRFDGTSWGYFGPQEGLPGYRHKVRADRRGRPWFLGLNTSCFREHGGGHRCRSL